MCFLYSNSALKTPCKTFEQEQSHFSWYARLKLCPHCPHWYSADVLNIKDFAGQVEVSPLTIFDLLRIFSSSRIFQIFFDIWIFVPKTIKSPSKGSSITLMLTQKWGKSPIALYPAETEGPSPFQQLNHWAYDAWEKLYFKVFYVGLIEIENYYMRRGLRKIMFPNNNNTMPST